MTPAEIADAIARRTTLSEEIDAIDASLDRGFTQARARVLAAQDTRIGGCSCPSEQPGTCFLCRTEKALRLALSYFPQHQQEQGLWRTAAQSKRLARAMRPAGFSGGDEEGAS